MHVRQSGGYSLTATQPCTSSGSKTAVLRDGWVAATDTTAGMNKETACLN